MTADFSRNSHRPELGFSAVRLQQGRVQLDADWNEQVDIITDAGVVTDVNIAGQGDGLYADGDELTIAGGDGAATFTINIL